ncbi:hypothetical protein FPOA_06457 [Fusarium poae]|uniref:LysM domain-containing protein n=1 Tax=Fusarium poae TaxID=36050 RepID=A0A1B8AZK5_FUSPO|nr:hypothetical protein FPOA_06457 [Fusarium poae]
MGQWFEPPLDNLQHEESVHFSIVFNLAVPLPLMHLSHLLVHGLLAITAGAARHQKIRRQNGPTDPGIASDCTYWELVGDDSQDCSYLEDLWELDHEIFVDYNPSVKSDCSGIQVGHSYCVEVNNGFPREEDPIESTNSGDPKPEPTQDSEPEPTKEPEHSPTQDGLIDTCTGFYKAVKGDTCAKVLSKHNIVFDDFLKWNPAIEKDCSGLWADTWYCVDVPGASHVTPSVTSKPTVTSTSSVDLHSPTQEGLAQKCNKFHKVTSTTTCSSIGNYYKLPLAQFIDWNPAVGKDCSGLWKGYWVCVSVEGYVPSTLITTNTPTTTKPANGIVTPLPIQNNMVKNCEHFHQVKSTTTCTSIESYYNLPLSTFLSWNPAVGKDCTSLLANYYVCVGTIGWEPPTKTTARPTTTTRSNGIKTPPPVQPGMVRNCNKFHMVTKTTTCSSIQDYYKISLTDFTKWNPAVGTKCMDLWAGYNVCVSIIGGTPTKSESETPTPIQAGMVSNCKKFHRVTLTTTCASIQNYYRISMAQIAKWNPAVGSKCTALLTNYVVCVGV